jgi:hypothetical protein
MRTFPIHNSVFLSSKFKCVEHVPGIIDKQQQDCRRRTIDNFFFFSVNIETIVEIYFIFNPQCTNILDHRWWFYSIFLYEKRLTCPKSMVRLTSLYFMPLDRGGLCHQFSVPSMAYSAGWLLSGRVGSQWSQTCKKKSLSVRLSLFSIDFKFG